MTFFECFFLLLMGHAIADYALQTEWVACNKNRHGVPKGYDPDKHGPMQAIWPYVLTSHALVHGAMVFLFLQDWRLALAETICHWVIDFGKCEKWYGIHTDQTAHILCKAVWVLVYLL